MVVSMVLVLEHAACCKACMFFVDSCLRDYVCSLIIGVLVLGHAACISAFAKADFG